jgi:signal transduction histidine kinase
MKMEILFQFLDKIRQPVLVLYEKNFFYANKYLLIELGFNRDKKPVSLVQILPTKLLHILDTLTENPEIVLELCSRFGNKIQYRAQKFPLHVNDTRFEFFLLQNDSVTVGYLNTIVSMLEDLPFPCFISNEHHYISYINNPLEKLDLIEHSAKNNPITFPQLFTVKTPIDLDELNKSSGSGKKVEVTIKGNRKYDLLLISLRTERDQFFGTLGTFLEQYEYNIGENLSAYQPIGIFTSTAIQNFNNFLNIVLGQAELAQSRYSDLNEMDVIKNEIENLRPLLNQLDEKSQNYQSNEIKAINLNQLIINEVEIFKANNFFKNRVNLQLKLQKDLSCIYGNYADLSQAFIQLIYNAVEAMYQSQRMDFTISTEQAGDKIICKVSDSGIGISEVHLDKIFTPFYTTKSKKRNPFTDKIHLGLGLFKVQETLKRMDASCSVQSQENMGTTFTLDFPTHAKNKNVLQD